MSFAAAPLAAQIQSVDPNDAYEAPIDGDLHGVETELLC